MRSLSAAGVSLFWTAFIHPTTGSAIIITFARVPAN